MKKDGGAMYRARSFDHLKGLDGISDSQLAEHLDLYAGYVKQVNALTQELSEMRSERRASGKDFGLAEGTRRLAFEYDGMVLHEFYFSNLKPGGAARPSDRQAFGRALAETFGSVDHRQENFQAMGGMRGVGWVIRPGASPCSSWTGGSTPSCVTTRPPRGSNTWRPSSATSTGRSSISGSTRSPGCAHPSQSEVITPPSRAGRRRR